MSKPPPDLSRLQINRDRPEPAKRGSLRIGGYIAGAAGVLALGIFLVTRGGPPTEVHVVLAEVRGGGGQSTTGLTANGYVVARTKAAVASKIAGRLAYLGVGEGSVVRQGEVIARLEHADYAAALAEREAELARAWAALQEAQAERDQLERDVTRAEELLDQGLIPVQEVEVLSAELEAAGARVQFQEAQVRAAKAAVGVARANLENTNIRAPFDGTILEKNAEVGEVVAPAVSGGGLTRGAVVTMADLETLEVEVDVNELYIAQIRSGQPALITINAYPDTSYPGRVRQIVPTADRQKATILVKVSFVDLDPHVLPEMGAKVEFMEETSAESQDGAPARVFVPAAAVRSEGGRQVVWLLQDGRLKRREVDAAPVTGGWREVRRGLSGGEQVVIGGPPDLQEGMRATISTRQ